MADTDRIPGNTESSALVEHGTAQPLARLDRSRSLLRLPSDLIEPALDFAHLQAMPTVAAGAPAPRFPEAVAPLEAAGIMTDGQIDPMAQTLLDVVNQASMTVTVDVSFGGDESTATIWATSRHAVLGDSLGNDYLDYRPVPVSQLPQTLAQLILLESPRFVGDVLLELDQSLIGAVKACRTDAAAAQLLVDAGLDAEQAALMVELQRPAARRWRITSRWSTDAGPQEAEMVGVDGADYGQWLITAETAGNGDRPRVLYTPQGHGEVMSGFRAILPRNWLGRPLNPRPTTLIDVR